MDTKSTKDANGCVNKPVALNSLHGGKVEDGSNRECCSDSNSLLPLRRGGMSRKLDKRYRKVQWNDMIGNKLAEVLEYELSDVSDSEDDDSCICSIM